MNIHGFAAPCFVFAISLLTARTVRFCRFTSYLQVRFIYEVLTVSPPLNFIRVDLHLKLVNLDNLRLRLSQLIPTCVFTAVFRAVKCDLA